MTRTFILACILALSNVVAFTQTVDGPVSTLDYRFLAPASQALHLGRLNTSYYDRGGIVEFDGSLTSGVFAVEFERIRASRLFHCGEAFLASTAGGEVHFYNDSSKQWRLIGTYDCQPYVVGEDMYVLSDGSVLRLRRSGSAWVDSVVGIISTDSDDVNSFVVVGDSIVFSRRNSAVITIALLNGVLLRTVLSPYTVDGLSVLADGSIAITSDYRTSKVLKTDSIDAGNISNLEYQGSILSLTNASKIESKTARGIVGLFSVPGSDPREGVYVVVSPDSVVKLSGLDKVVENIVLVTIQGNDTILSSYRHLCVLDGKGDTTRARWYKDTVLSVSQGVSFTPSGIPFLCGDIKTNGSTSPMLYPISDSGNVEILPIADSKARLLIRYVHLQGGPEVAFCSFGIYTKSDSATWSNVYLSLADIQSRHIDIVNDSTIVCRSPGRMILLSVDKGSTWRSIIIKDYLWDMTPVISAGTTLFAHSQGNVWALDLEDPSDSVAPPRIRITPGPHQRLYACSPNNVQVVSARSDVDADYQPEYYTHLTCYRWTPTQQLLDSVAHRLDEPMKSDGLTIIVRNDTAYFWNAVQRRMLAVNYQGVIYDTVLNRDTFAPFSDQPLTTVVYDNVGVPWLFASGLVTGFKLDPSKPLVTSVEDYYDYMYVGSLQPNPAKDIVTVTLGRFPAAIETSVQLYLVDLQGTVVRDFTDRLLPFSGPVSTQSVQINVDGLPWGMYLVVIQNSQGKSVGKLIVTP